MVASLSVGNLSRRCISGCVCFSCASSSYALHRDDESPGDKEFDSFTENKVVVAVQLEGEPGQVPERTAVERHLVRKVGMGLSGLMNYMVIDIKLGHCYGSSPRSTPCLTFAVV